ncbi:MAG: AP2 domain-containing protein, partial [Planctomycetota bacterium]
INHNGLDNRRANLRLATRAQNSRNVKKPPNRFSSRYKGVSWHAPANKWVARITSNKETTTIGFFEGQIEAAKAYDEAAKKLHAKFAALNFPH